MWPEYNPEDEEQGHPPVQMIDGPVGELGEGVVVAGICDADEVLLALDDDATYGSEGVVVAGICDATYGGVSPTINVALATKSRDCKPKLDKARLILASVRAEITPVA